MNSTTFLVAVSIGLASQAAAQLTLPTKDPVIGARMPALSPDGKQLAFVYRGDIWLAPSAGGSARPLTQHVEAEANPIFSPDGDWVAFASKRNGNWDIFAVPSSGGTPRQLTWHSGNETPQGWSPDGTKLLFAGRRDSPNNAIYSIDVTSLRTEVLVEDFAQLSTPNFSSDGKTIVYGRYGFPWTRARYHGSAAQQIWLLDVAAGKRRAITTNEAQHLWTQFMPGGSQLLTVTVGEKTPSASSIHETIDPVVDSPGRTPNLWLFNREGQGRPLTRFIGGSVRFPTVAAKSGDIAFEYGTDLWMLRNGRQAPEKLDLLVAADEKQTTRRREKLTNGVNEAELSPDGKLFAFGLRGDVWTVATEKPKGVAGRNADFANRLTDWAGDDSDFSWSPDGTKLYFTSDREFTTRLYELDVKTGKAASLWDGSDNISRVMVSPDGKQLGFWVSGKDGGLYVLEIATGESRRVVRLPGPQWRGVGGGDFVWSPDMRWIAYSARSESRAWNIFVVPASGGEPVNVTRLYAQHSNPAWSMDGKFLYFESGREGDGLYALPLKPEAVRSEDTDLKYEKPGTNLVVEIDFKNISSRIRKISSQAPRADLVAIADGSLLFLSEGDIWTVSYDGKQTRRLTTGGGKTSLRVPRNGKKASFLQGGEMYTMPVDGKGPAERVTFKAEWERDTRAVRKAAFTQFWNAYQRGFYDPNFHGRDWFALREAYEPMLDAVDTDDEFSTLLNMMVGELDASHSEVRPARGNVNSPSSPHLGFTFDYNHAGPGLRVATVPGDAPGAFEKTAIKPGDFILAINGEDAVLSERLYEMINDRADREFEFLVSSNGDRFGARTVRYKALTAEQWAELNYRNRIEKLRHHVEEKSAGRIGYVHIEAMGVNNQVKFEREAYEYMAGKEAMIIDVRFNRGGNIADTLIDWIERKPHGWVRPRDAAPEATPYRVWEKKCVVLMNEHSYSNGEIFPSAMRTRGLATLVGMPTPGYVIWTFDQSLVDGTGARLPLTGSYRLDGSNQENIGEYPDHLVPLTPEDWLAGRDPQLDKAVELITGTSEGKKAQVAGQ
jgi:tricorn protease